MAQLLQFPEAPARLEAFVERLDCAGERLREIRDAIERAVHRGDLKDDLSRSVKVTSALSQIGFICMELEELESFGRIGQNLAIDIEKLADVMVSLLPRLEQVNEQLLVAEGVS